MRYGGAFSFSNVDVQYQHAKRTMLTIYHDGEEYEKDLERRRKASRRMRASFIYIAELIMSLGGEASFEWPKSCAG